MNIWKAWRDRRLAQQRATRTEAQEIESVGGWIVLTGALTHSEPSHASAPSSAIDTADYSGGGGDYGGGGSSSSFDP